MKVKFETGEVEKILMGYLQDKLTLGDVDIKPTGYGADFEFTVNDKVEETDKTPDEKEDEV